MRDSAIVQLKKIRGLDPDNLSTLHMLSNYYLEVDQTDDAKQMLREALDKNQRNPKTLVMLADIYVEEAQWDSVGTLLGNVVSDPIVNKEAKLDVTQYLFSRYQQEPNNKHLKLALENMLTKFTETAPEYGPAYALAADYYLNENNNTEALKALAKTNELAPRNDMAWRQRMQLLLAEGRYTEVIEAGKKADEYLPGSFYTLLYRQRLPGNRPAAGVLKLVRKSLPDALAQTVQVGYLWLNGRCLFGPGPMGGCKKILRAGPSLDPQNHNVLNNYAYYLSERDEQLEKAEKMALKAIEQVPDNPSYLDTVGWVYYKRGIRKGPKIY
ncbi:MAG: hypothetical protein U5K69_29885 [Balneolaceae bacterium]|nr:hypothetical protein [Balneolaceae bacterium]